MWYAWKKRISCWVLVGKPKENRPHGRLRRRWKCIKMDLREIGRMWTQVIWIRPGYRERLL
jgi:hypothetical protein